MKKIKNYCHNFMFVLILFFGFWFTLTNIIQAFKCEKMTQTELFLNIPKSILLNFKEC